MIERYTRPEMGALWTQDAKYQAWLDVELAACRALAVRGQIPADALAEIEAKAAFDSARIEEIELEVKHDVIAFLTSVAEHVGPSSRFIHLGLTSSDVVDTGFALQLKRSGVLLLEGMDRLYRALVKLAWKHKDTLMIGRSHGIHAEPITFGLKVAVWCAEAQRNRQRLVSAIAAVSAGMLSGAVGTFANIDPGVEDAVCAELGLTPELASTQVISRDRHAEFFGVLAVIAGSIEKIAVEIRHLQRTEVLEAEEPFSAGQKGSSAMPHKRNPILSENLTGLARLLRGYAGMALEDIALWHERDISHSSVERVIGPDACIVMDFMFHRASGLLERLVVYPQRMLENLHKMHGLIFSQRVLLALTEKGMLREDAYRVVQRSAMQVWEANADFKSLLAADLQIQPYLNAQELTELFDLAYHTRNIDAIFARVFPEGQPR
ncbi:MAG: adenylosuccinate lyase [Acidithiobacillus ferriphilus]|uniref:adenylosuccinate lyase n=1 Tax=Acidithiobacillus ferriphilus TaxID=1689834 RepID=UPI001C06357C|nr:adenylosuccinate lyase [Acidithiobacillus ferriphilus]MBU2786526.1 adenylosuccinate lyase [Acidithiobacillus ferriphilus]MBU2846537.1 adenylosuccinate lyase [Acidithiobacillus ferriphilus]UEP58526.1 adenylosuccinate lyase [Acidithiobacillus ferriphilus]